MEDKDHWKLNTITPKKEKKKEKIDKLYYQSRQGVVKKDI
jgi:hypothetical protein